MHAKTILGFSLALSLGLLGLALHEYRATQDVDAALQSGAARDGGLVAELQRKENRLAAAERTSAELTEALKRVPPKNVAPAPAAAGSVGDRAPFNVREVISRDPKLQALHVESERLGIGGRYGVFFHATGLNAGQVAKLTDALLRHSERLLDLDGTARAQNLTADDPAIATLRRQADDELRTAQLEVLGDAGYQRLQEYERTRPARGEINQLAGALAVNGTPLTVEQGERLVQILANANSVYRGGGTVSSPWEGLQASGDPRWNDRLPDRFDWTEVKAKARDVLSAAQFVLFQQQLTKFEQIGIFNLVYEAQHPKPGVPPRG